MTVNYTTLLALAQPVDGTETGTWGDDVNNGITSYLDIAIAGTLTLSTDTSVTLSQTEGNSSGTNIGSTTSQYAIILLTGARTAARTVTLPSSSKIYVVINQTTGGYATTFKGAATTGVAVVPGVSTHIAWNGSDFQGISSVVGSLGFVDTNILASYQSSVNSYSQIINQNSYNGSTASADFIVANNLGTASTYYGDFGMNSSGFTGSGSFNLANGVYLSATSGDLVLGTTTSNAVHFVINGSATDAATITTGGQWQTSADASIHGLTVGLGAGSVSNNTVVGNVALPVNTSGAYNTAIGYGSLNLNTTGSYNIAVGSATASTNAALASNTSGGSNVAVGTGAIGSNTTGSNITAVGYQAGYGGTVGSNATFLGYQAGYGANASTVAGIGYQALYSNTSGNANTAVGDYQTMYSNTTGSNNVAVGRQALYSNTAGSAMVAIGYQAFYNAQTSSNSVAIGYQAAYTTSGGNADGDVSIGYRAGYTKNTATDSGASVFVGLNAGTGTTGIDNTFVGGNSAASNSSGSKNVALGSLALYNNTTANYNTAVGYQALYAMNSNGQYTVALGYQAGYGCTSGNANTFIGAFAGSNLTTGYNCVYLGSNAQASSSSVNQEIVIEATSGSAITGKGSNTFYAFANAGSATGGSYYNGANSTLWSITSDQRLKKNIVNNTVGLDVINKIQVRNFEYRLPEEVDASLAPTDAILQTGVQLGVIAQELQQVLPDCIKTESTGVMSVDSSNLIWHMVNAIQELSAQNADLQAKLKSAGVAGF